MNSFDKIAHMLNSFHRLADQIIAESEISLSADKIVKNFKNTGEYKRISKDLKEEEIKKLDDRISEAISAMCESLSKTATKFNEKKVEFIQFSNPDKSGGFDGGYLIPTGIHSFDALNVSGPMKKKDGNRNNRIVTLGEYLTKEAWKKIKP